MIYFTHFESPVGPLLLRSDGERLTGLYMNAQQHHPEMDANWKEEDAAAPLAETKRQLAAYFEGTLTDFDLPLHLEGTAFQQKVWAELIKIPYGSTWSYGELARKIERPSASRAVGMANGRNPIGIIVPCHRVIGSNGKLIGYGGGLARKEALLSMEKRVLAARGSRTYVPPENARSGSAGVHAVHQGA